MKISIITVCKNPGESIKKTVESVLSQTYKDIEYIIVDGASTDGTVEGIRDAVERWNGGEQQVAGVKVERWNGLSVAASAKTGGVEENSTLTRLHNYTGEHTGSPLLKFVSEPDTGIYNAMNKGIDMATGDVLYFLNAGDELFNDKVIENVVNEFERTSSDIVHGDILLDGSFIKSAKKLSRYVFLIDTINHQSIFMKSTIIKKNGNFNEKYKIAADYDLLLKMFFDNDVKIKYIPLIIANYPTDGISSSCQSFKELETERSLIQDSYFSGFEKFIVKLPMIKKIIRYIWRLQCRRYQ